MASLHHSLKYRHTSNPGNFPGFWLVLGAGIGMRSVERLCIASFVVFITSWGHAHAQNIWRCYPSRFSNRRNLQSAAALMLKGLHSVLAANCLGAAAFRYRLRGQAKILGNSQDFRCGDTSSCGAKVPHFLGRKLLFVVPRHHR